MFKFNPDDLKFEYYRLKSITTALGGSMTIIDEDETDIRGKEVHYRMSVPMALARSFIKRCNKVIKYLKPTWICVARYNGVIVAIERHPLSSMGAKDTVDENGVTRSWKPSMIGNYTTIVQPFLNETTHDWYFDGRYVFKFETPDMCQAVRQGTDICSTAPFKEVTVQAIDFQDLHDSHKLAPSERQALGYYLDDQHFAVSPPIWKNLASIGAKSKDEFDEDDSVSGSIVQTKHNFEWIDNNMGVNLNFALRAGRLIGQTFGYEETEPLFLGRLMIELHTVNLPAIDKSVKRTFDIGMKFSHAAAWILGLLHRSPNFETYLSMRSLLKYLTSVGVFDRNALKEQHILREGMTFDDIPAVYLEDLISDHSGQLVIMS